jgi:hypothetical protein
MFYNKAMIFNKYIFCKLAAARFPSIYPDLSRDPISAYDSLPNVVKFFDSPPAPSAPPLDEEVMYPTYQFVSSGAAAISLSRLAEADQFYATKRYETAYNMYSDLARDIPAEPLIHFGAGLSAIEMMKSSRTDAERVFWTNSTVTYLNQAIAAFDAKDFLDFAQRRKKVEVLTTLAVFHVETERISPSVERFVTADPYETVVFPEGVMAVPVPAPTRTVIPVLFIANELLGKAFDEADTLVNSLRAYTAESDVRTTQFEANQEMIVAAIGRLGKALSSTKHTSSIAAKLFAERVLFSQLGNFHVLGSSISETTPGISVHQEKALAAFKKFQAADKKHPSPEVALNIAFLEAQLEHSNKDIRHAFEKAAEIISYLPDGDLEKTRLIDAASRGIRRHPPQNDHSCVIM